MALRIKSSQDFWTGCVFMAFGGGTVALAQGYPLGSAARMGPAYFPTVLGALLAAIGLVMLLKSLGSADGGNVERVNVWLLLRVLRGGGSVRRPAPSAGPRAYRCRRRGVLAASAGHEFRVGEALISAAVLALLSYALFVWGLNQTMPVWPWFLAV